MLKITRINGVLNATIYSLTETAPLKLKEPGQFGNRVSLVMCSAFLKARICKARICNVCFYSLEEETQKKANDVHQL